MDPHPAGRMPSPAQHCLHRLSGAGLAGHTAWLGSWSRTTDRTWAGKTDDGSEDAIPFLSPAWTWDGDSQVQKGLLYSIVSCQLMR